MSELVEGEDYEFNDEGLMVFTAHYLRKRGYCCQNGCQNCPYPPIQAPPAPATPPSPSGTPTPEGDCARPTRGSKSTRFK